MTSVPFLPAYTAARQRVGLVERSSLAWVLVSGHDRASYLQGLLTNDIQALRAGTGCYAAYLTAQGRMICDLRVYELGDVLMLALDVGVKDAVIARLDQFIFAEDVQLGDVSEHVRSLAVVGPEAVGTLASVLGVAIETLASLPEHGNLRTSWRGETMTVLRVTDLGVHGFEVVTPEGLARTLAEAMRAAGAVDVDASTAEVLRVEAGVPRFQIDMDSETIPLEAGIESRAISFTKGCYVGQEVIIRVLHRGHGRVARHLMGLVADAGVSMTRGTLLLHDGQPVGEVTSAVESPAIGRCIGLGYVRRGSAEPGTRVYLSTGGDAEVASLPIVESGR